MAADESIAAGQAREIGRFLRMFRHSMILIGPFHLCAKLLIEVHDTPFTSTARSTMKRQVRSVS